MRSGKSHCHARFWYLICLSRTGLSVSLWPMVRTDCLMITPWHTHTHNRRHWGLSECAQHRYLRCQYDRCCSRYATACASSSASSESVQFKLGASGEARPVWRIHPPPHLSVFFSTGPLQTSSSSRIVEADWVSGATWQKMQGKARIQGLVCLGHVVCGQVSGGDGSGGR